MSNSALIRVVVAGCSVLALQACTTLPVKTDSNPALSASNCHSYAFAQEHMANAGQPSAFGNPLNAERLRVAIEANLAAKGILHAADSSSAECVVGYAMGTRQVFNDYYGGFGLGVGFGGYGDWDGYGGWGGFGGPWGGGYGGGPYVREETRIAVDLFDAKSRKPIWHATVSQSIADLTGPNAEARINAATAAIFTKFPGSVPLPAAGHTSG